MKVVENKGLQDRVRELMPKVGARDIREGTPEAEDASEANA
jgi:hypothetical protein